MLSDYVFKSKYAKYLTDKKRRENWSEAAERMMAMHLTRFPQLQDEIKFCLSAILDKKVVGSQRALQFGGEAILERNMRMHNCVSSYADRPRFFSEYLWLLMSGCGAGFSIQSHHVSQLPAIKQPAGKKHHTVGDSAEGFAEAVDTLFNAYFEGSEAPEFDYSVIRPEGVRLRFGGKAPGPMPIRNALERVTSVLEGSIGRNMRPIEVFQCAMHLALSVGKGGSRRCASIATFDINDEEMLRAKTGQWFITHPEYACANISAVALRSDIEFADFKNVFQYTKEFGEPAVIFQSSKEFTYNPCVEALMCPMLISHNGKVVQNYTLDLIEYKNREHWISKGYSFESGWQACNLSSINGALIKNVDDFKQAAIAASILGTLQCTYSDTGYLGSVSKLIMERENLLGVSICGVMDSPDILLNQDILREVAELVKETNVNLANKLNINPSSRVTLEKPEGSTSLVFQSGFGIHPRHGKQYIRRVYADSSDPLVQAYEKINPLSVTTTNAESANKIIAFAETSPEGSLTRHDMSAVEFMDIAKRFYQGWVLPGTRPNRLERATHNISMTVSVKPDEWNDVQNFFWNNRQYFCGISFLPMSGDYVYKNPPYQEVSEPTSESTPEQIEAWEYWNALKNSTAPFDFDCVLESEDITDVAEEVACGGGLCLL